MLEELNDRVRMLEEEVAGLKEQLEAIRERLPGEDFAPEGGRSRVVACAGGGAIIARAGDGHASLLLLRPPGVPAIALDTAQGGRVVAWNADGEALVLLCRKDLDDAEGKP